MTEYKKNKISKAFWSQTVSVWKEWKIVLDTATDTHCIYLVSTRILRGCFDSSSFPREISEAARWGVSISDQGAHLEVFRGEWTQMHNGSPWGLPCSAQFEPPIINIAGGKRGGGWHCVHVHKKKKMYVRVWVMHHIVCACDHHTLLCAPWHHFPSHDQLVCCNIPRRFQTLLNTHALSPGSLEAAVTKASLPLQCLNLLVSNNIWFWWRSWLHQHSCVCVRLFCVFLRLPPRWDTDWELMGNMHSGNRRPEGGIGRKWRRDFWLSQYNMIAGFNLFLIIHVVSE